MTLTATASAPALRVTGSSISLLRGLSVQLGRIVGGCDNARYPSDPRQFPQVFKEFNQCLWRRFSDVGEIKVLAVRPIAGPQPDPLHQQTHVLDARDNVADRQYGRVQLEGQPLSCNRTAPHDSAFQGL